MRVSNFILVLVFLLLSLPAYTQNVSEIYSSVKKANKSIYAIEDSTLLISYKIYNRFTQEANLVYYAYIFNTLSESHLDFYMTRVTGSYLFKDNNFSPISKDGDTLRNQGKEK